MLSRKFRLIPYKSIKQERPFRPSLARDLAGLIQAGYRLAEVRLVDMFPQTAHQETMVRLERE